jgi:hypothetical protein
VRLGFPHRYLLQRSAIEQLEPENPRLESVLPELIEDIAIQPGPPPKNLWEL